MPLELVAQSSDLHPYSYTLVFQNIHFIEECLVTTPAASILAQSARTVLVMAYCSICPGRLTPPSINYKMFNNVVIALMAVSPKNCNKKKHEGVTFDKNNGSEKFGSLNIWLAIN
ncbi:hypothetical protein TNCT_27381 [Trichonephila clavata]|uniref:Uncharacterized protein n=1 Tax=Trichonephila clavata TaxID=2740835 RepID=A0A8X6FTZ8_TRICU|nr:hypothetical protein TNCT_27381 [Trichonephila clavata]